MKNKTLFELREELKSQYRDEIQKIASLVSLRDALDELYYEVKLDMESAHDSAQRVRPALEEIVADIDFERKSCNDNLRARVNELTNKLKSMRIPVITEYGTVFEAVPCPTLNKSVSTDQVDLWFEVVVGNRATLLDTTFDLTKLALVTEKTKRLHDFARIVEIRNVHRTPRCDFEMTLFLHDGSIVVAVSPYDQPRLVYTIKECVQNGDEVRLVGDSPIFDQWRFTRIPIKDRITGGDLRMLSLRRITVIGDDGKERLGIFVLIKSFYGDKLSALTDTF